MTELIFFRLDTTIAIAELIVIVGLLPFLLRQTGISRIRLLLDDAER